MALHSDHIIVALIHSSVACTAFSAHGLGLPIGIAIPSPATVIDAAPVTASTFPLLLAPEVEAEEEAERAVNRVI